MTYRLIDHTKSGKGYLTLLCDGKRVCDFFPFSPQTTEGFVRKQAQLIMDTMNAVHAISNPSHGTSPRG